MINTACRLLLLLSLALAGCAGGSPGPDRDDGDDDADDGDDEDDPPGDDPGDPGDPGGGTAACDAAWACSDTCGEQMGCADTDDACWQGCDSQCGVEQACAGDPGDPGDPGGGDPAACDAAWACSDMCGEQMSCQDDTCWEQCDASCGLEEACAGVEDPTDPGGGGDVPTCDEAWACSDQCGEQNDCGYDDACWEQCDAQCQLEEACAGEF